ncbi:Protein MtfA [Maioricimonas rarisocia]|uniref:Protein MtfA n=1 Tax=Maioricimonas rarisocia TaxID=2528026 RepID=A0A517YZX5_9PLAN|nr:M90 family metallopeptidase [Maioricimonas rarisocia]QDU35788.1 Protein MtfA [Maioricimonas rarisocia]
MFGWWRRWRRTRILQDPFPDDWEAILERSFPHQDRLSANEQTRLRERIQIFVAEKHWEGCRGLTMTDEIRVLVAAHACLLTLGLSDDVLNRVLSILVYPTAYVAKEIRQTGPGVIVHGRQLRSGEAWYRGPVILSWEDIEAGTHRRTRGRNLVMHEFAHQLDMLNGGTVDGTPPLADAALRERWDDVMERAYRQLQEDCHRYGRNVLDCYGTTNRAEFFAVATEAFFESPRRLLRQDGALYGVLSAYYLQDPAGLPEGTAVISHPAAQVP